jgi:hypothetical protein
MRNRIAAIFVAALAVACIIAGSAVAKTAAKPTKFTASLNAAQEVPKPKGASSKAEGTFTAVLTGSTLKWAMNFSHLTGSATAAHIHLGAKGKSGGVIVPLCGPCKTPLSGSTKLSATVIKDLQSGKSYVNIHTAKNPNGEIRGQIS